MAKGNNFAAGILLLRFSFKSSGARMTREFDPVDADRTLEVLGERLAAETEAGSRTGVSAFVPVALSSSVVP